MTGSTDYSLILTIPIMIAFWGWVVWAILLWRKMNHKSRLQNKIVDKFSSGQEFNDFLQSQEGNKFLSFLKFDSSGPRQKILSSLSAGIILPSLGIAFIIIGQIIPTGKDYFNTSCNAAGIIFVALGVGFLISTFISYKMCKKWGLLDENHKT